MRTYTFTPLGLAAMITVYLTFLAPARGQAMADAGFDAFETTTVETSLRFPTYGTLGGVAVDQIGRIYMSNFRGTVWRIELDGSVDVLATGLYGASGNTVRRDGTLLQANFYNGTIVAIDGDGRITPFAEGIFAPVGVAEAPSGEIFTVACAGGQVMRISADGAEVSEFSKDPRLVCPNGLTFGPDGTLYVVSFRNTRVLAYDTESGAVRQLAHLPGQGNSHIAFFGGALYVTQIHTHAIFRVEMDGSYSRVSGNGTRGFNDGLGEAATISYPNGIASDPFTQTLVFNTLRGPRRGGPGEMILRRLVPPTLVATMERAFASAGLDGAMTHFDGRLATETGEAQDAIVARATAAARQISSRGNSALAIAMIDRLLVAAPDARAVLTAAGDVNANAGNFGRARGYYEKLAAQYPDDQDIAKRLEDMRDYR